MMESRVDCLPNTILQRYCHTDVYCNSGERKLRRLRPETGLSCHSNDNVKLVLRFEMTQQASIAECRDIGIPQECSRLNTCQSFERNSILGLGDYAI